MIVANEGLEKAVCLNQVPGTDGFTECGAN